ncbi:MAG: hypothetical protein E6713_09120 [Sporomusaceae bacterium]|nr:hypothetical protein [Sporomusaceae bacterium]
MTKQEQTVIAFFPSKQRAEQAVAALSKLGLHDTHIKRNSRFGESENYTIDSAIASAETLTGLTLFSENQSNQSNQSRRVLLGADPSVSGFSRSGNDLAGSHPFTLVTFVPEAMVEQAVTVLRNNGGLT